MQDDDNKDVYKASNQLKPTIPRTSINKRDDLLSMTNDRSNNLARNY